MSQQSLQPTTQPKADDENHGESEVTVTIDNTSKKIHRGSHLVSALKTLLGVDPAKALDEVVAGVLTPLEDDGRVTIKGGEEFFSHARTGGAS
jgi:hypothetical protein